MAAVTLASGDEINLGKGTHTIDGSGNVSFSSINTTATFSAAGAVGDTLTLPGSTSDYQIRRDGTYLVLTHKMSGQSIYMASGVIADTINFSNQSLTLQYALGTGVKLGTQTLTATGQAIAGTSSTDGSTSPPSVLTLASSFSFKDTDWGTPLSENDTSIRALNSNKLWLTKNLSYGFNTSVPNDYYGISSSSTLSGNLTAGWASLSNSEKEVVRQAFAQLEALVPLSFSEISPGNNADLRFNVISTQSGIGGFAYLPNTTALGGDVFLATTSRTTYNYTAGDQAYLTVIHELGHAMGLKHPFEAPIVLQDDLNNWTHTVMSYTPARNMLLNFTHSESEVRVDISHNASPSMFSLLDIATLQSMYGHNTSYRTGADTYAVSSAKHEYMTIWDAGGLDSLEAATATGPCTVDLRPGHFSSMDVRSLASQLAETLANYHAQGITSVDTWVGAKYTQYSESIYTGENNIAIAHGTWIENVTTGSAADIIRDNALDNRIAAGAGNDTIHLLEGGFDTVNGGEGFDVIQIANVSSQIQKEVLSNGSILLVGSYFAVELTAVEQLTFSDGNILALA